MMLVANALLSRVGMLLLMGFLFLIAAALAKPKGYFHLAQEVKQTNPLPATPLLIVFGIYLFVSLFFSVLILHLLIKLIPNFINLPLAEKKIYITSYTHFLTTTLIFILLIFYIFHLQKKYRTLIWKEGSSSYTKDLLLSLATWAMAFPLTLFIRELLELLLIFFFHMEEFPDQVAILFLQKTLSYPAIFLAATLAICFLGPVIEEILFRGFLQNWLKGKMGRKTSILLTSLCFAFFHFSFSQKMSNIPIIGTLFVFSLFLCFLYERQRSLIAPIALHVLFNTVSILNLFLIKEL